MKKTFKILNLILSLIITISAFTGCSGRKEGYPPVWTPDKRVVMTVGVYNVTYDFYRYLFLNTKDFFDNGDESFWQKEENNVDLVKDYVFDSIKDTYGMFTLADKYDITLSDDDKANIESYIESSKEGMTDEEFEKSLEEAYMTKELYKFVLEVQQLEYLVYEHIINESSGILKFDDTSLMKAIDEDFVRATHILLTFKNEEESNTKLETANQILKKLKNGEDFETLKEQYSEDTDLKNNTDGYYFTHGEFENEFEYAAFELKEGEISEVVTTEVGYHIIKRLPIEKEYVNKNIEALRAQYKTALYYELIEEAYKNFTPEYKDEYKNIQLDSFN